MLNTQLNSLPPKGEAESWDFSICLFWVEQRGGSMVSISPCHHLHFSPGNLIVLDPSEFQAWQDRSQSFGESPQKSWGARHAN